MRFAADSSVLVRLYLDAGQAQTIARFLAEDPRSSAFRTWLESRS